MLIGGALVLAVGLAMLVLLIARGSRSIAITREDFEGAFDELVADGQAEDADRDEVWRQFHYWQLRTEEERLEQEEATDP
jgi:hypothetical protein